MASKQPFVNDSGNRQNISFPASSIEMSDGTTAQAAVESLRQSDTSFNTFKASIESKYRKADTAYAKDSMSYAVELPAGFYLECNTAGTTNTGALSLPATIVDGTTFQDGTVNWTIRKTGGSNTSVTLTRDSVIDALGYTPSNSGLTKTELTQMIQSGELGDVSVVQLPYKQITTGTNTPPASNYDGIFTWATKTDSSAKIKFEDNNNPGSYGTATTVKNILGSGNFGANEIAYCGLTIGSSAPGVGVSLAVIQDGICMKFKGTDGTYQYKSKNKTSASCWSLLCDRYGLLGQAESIACIQYGTLTLSSWKTWDFSSFSKGVTSWLVKLDGKQFYTCLLFKYGSGNPHAYIKYGNYDSTKVNAGSLVMIPMGISSDDNYNCILMFGFDTSQKPKAFMSWKYEAKVTA